MTTSDLVSQVAVSRFAVMKHLTALQRAGLLVIAREGRLRWNRLNPLPLVELHRRWVLPEEAAHADRLLRLQHHSLHPEVVRMPSLNTFRALDIVIELDIAAPPPRVWEALTRDISQWWPGKFYVGTAPRRFVIEAFVGGRVFEDWDDGAGSLFGTVTAYQAPHTLQWAADLSADFGGPARTVTTFRIAEGGTPGTSRLTFRDTPFGQLAPAVQSGLEAGWRWLLTRCFQPWVEEGLRPQRPASVEEAPRHA